MAPTLGQRLGKLRQSRKWTQSEVAQRLRVTAAAVSAYERDANQPSLEVLKRLAALYGVSADFLLGIDNTAAPERARQGGRSWRPGCSSLPAISPNICGTPKGQKLSGLAR